MSNKREPVDWTALVGVIAGVLLLGWMFWLYHQEVMAGVTH